MCIRDRAGCSGPGLIVPSCIREYDKVFDDVSALRDCSVILDEESVSYYMARAFDDSVDRIYRKSIIEEMRAIKNEGEIAATRRAHIRDGAAVVKMCIRDRYQVRRYRYRDASGNTSM